MTDEMSDKVFFARAFVAWYTKMVRKNGLPPSTMTEDDVIEQFMLVLIPLMQEQIVLRERAPEDTIH